MIQTDRYSCGPVAVVNAIKWAGNDNFNDRKMMEQIKVIADTKNKNRTVSGRTKYKGTSNDGIAIALHSRDEFRVVKEICDPSIKDIKKCLDMGGAVVLSCKNYGKKKKGHAMLVTHRFGKCYEIDNFISGEEFSPVSSTTLGKLLRASKRSMWQGRAWLLVKNKSWKPTNMLMLAS